MARPTETQSIHEAYIRDKARRRRAYRRDVRNFWLLITAIAILRIIGGLIGNY